MRYKEEVLKFYPNAILKTKELPLSRVPNPWIYNTNETNKKTNISHYTFYLILYSRLHRDDDFIACSEIGPKQAWKRAFINIQKDVLRELSK
jgi:hypothetical protein